MTRTTVDLDPTVLAELKRQRDKTGKTLGQLISELLAGSLSPKPAAPQPLEWISIDMEQLIDIEDKEAVQAALDER